MRLKHFYVVVAALAVLVAPLSTTASENQNASTSFHIGGSLKVTIQNEGQVSALVLFLRPDEEIKVNGEDSESQCLMINNLNEVDIRIHQDGNTRESRRSPQVEEEDIQEESVIAQVDAGNCLEVRDLGYPASGIYNIRPYLGCPERRVDVICDMTTDGGGWTIIQNRDLYGAQADFFRPWKDYLDGFGDLRHDFWLGIKHIYALTNQSNHEVRLDMTDFDNHSNFAKYGRFTVSDAAHRYDMIIDDFVGDDGQEPDLENCAILWESAWWFRNCYAGHQGTESEGTSERPWFEVMWEYWRGNRYPPRKSEIRIRPKALEEE